MCSIFKNVCFLIMLLYIPMAYTMDIDPPDQCAIGTQLVAKRLVLAVESRSIEEIKLALKAGFRPTRGLRNTSGNPILFGPAAYGRLDIIKLLFWHGAVLDEENAHGDTALMIAALRGRDNIVIALIGYGADPLHKNYGNLTALSYAAQKGCYLTCQILKPYYTPAYYAKTVDRQFSDCTYVPPIRQAVFEQMTTRAEMQQFAQMLRS